MLNSDRILIVVGKKLWVNSSFHMTTELFTCVKNVKQWNKSAEQCSYW
jgi:hypothetical protein